MISFCSRRRIWNVLFLALSHFFWCCFDVGPKLCVQEENVVFNYLTSLSSSVMERDERMALTIANKKLKQKRTKCFIMNMIKKATTTAATMPFAFSSCLGRFFLDFFIGTFNEKYSLQSNTIQHVAFTMMVIWFFFISSLVWSVSGQFSSTYSNKRTQHTVYLLWNCCQRRVIVINYRKRHAYIYFTHFKRK